MIITFSSCSVEKRMFNKGYYIDWHSSAKSTNNQASKSQDLATENSTKEVDRDVTEHIETNAPKTIVSAESEIEKVAEIAETDQVSTEFKGYSFSQIMKMPKSAVKTEIKNEFRKLKTLDLKAPAPAPRKMSTIIKLAIIITGLAMISLIIAFWSWYFYLLSGITGTAGVPVYRIFLLTGLISLALGLTLFILYWLTH